MHTNLRIISNRLINIRSINIVNIINKRIINISTNSLPIFQGALTAPKRTHDGL